MKLQKYWVTLLILLCAKSAFADITNPANYYTTYENKAKVFANLKIEELKSKLEQSTAAHSERYLVQRTLWLKTRNEDNFCKKIVKNDDYEAIGACYEERLKKVQTMTTEIKNLYRNAIQAKKYVAAATAGISLLKNSAFWGDYHGFEEKYKTLMQDIPRDATLSHLKLTFAVGTVYAASNSLPVIKNGIALLHEVEKIYENNKQQFEKEVYFLKYNLGILYLFKFDDSVTSEKYLLQSYGFDPIRPDSIIFHSLTKLFNGRPEGILADLNSIDFDSYKFRIRIKFLECYRNYLFFKLGAEYDLTYCHTLGDKEQLDVVLNITKMIGGDNNVAEKTRGKIFEQFWSYYKGNLVKLNSNTIDSVIDSVELKRAHSENQRKELELAKSQLLAKEQEQLRIMISICGAIAFLVGGFLWWIHKKNLELKLVREKHIRKSISVEFDQIATVLDNLNQGIVVIKEKSGKVDLHSIARSKNLLGIIKKYDLSKEDDIFKLFFSKTSLDPHKIKQIANLIQGFIGEDELNFVINSALLPRQVELFDRILDVEYSPIVDENNIINQLVISIKDISQLVDLKKELEANKREHEHIVQIIEHGVEDSRELISMSLLALQDFRLDDFDGFTSSKRRDHVKIILHNTKGNLQSAGFHQLATTVHKLEELLETGELNSRSKLFDQLLTELKELLTLLEHKLGAKALHRSEVPKISNLPTLVKLASGDDLAKERLHQTLYEYYYSSKKTLATKIEDLCSKISKGQGYEVTLEITGRTVKDLKLLASYEASFKTIFIHLINNSCAHATCNNKRVTVYINIEQFSASEFTICYRDSGIGLALNKLRNRFPPGTSDLEVAESIFDSGVSTTSQTSQLSGRGIGMLATKEAVGGLGGKIAVELLPGSTDVNFHYFQFKLRFPFTLTQEAPTDTKLSS